MAEENTAVLDQAAAAKSDQPDIGERIEQANTVAQQAIGRALRSALSTHRAPRAS